MRYLRDELHWHFRIRVKSNSWIYRAGKGWTQLNQYHLALGEVVLLQGVTLTKTLALDQLHLALARDPLGRQLWMVVSDEPTTLQTFREYGERFQIEEELLDEKSNGNQAGTFTNSRRDCPVSALLGHGGCHIAADCTRATSSGSR